MVTIEIDVQTRDILFGFRHAPDHCPIARAAERIGIENPRVTGSSMRVGGLLIPTPNEAESFVHRFDQEGRLSVKPFKFCIQVPENIVEKLKIKKSALIRCDRKLNMKEE